MHWFHGKGFLIIRKLHRNSIPPHYHRIMCMRGEAIANGDEVVEIISRQRYAIASPWGMR